MNGIKKLLGRVFPPYKFEVQRQEWTILMETLVNDLPNGYHSLKEQIQETRLLDLSDWGLFTSFRYIVKSYDPKGMAHFKKRRENYHLTGQQIFSRKINGYTNVHYIIHENILTGIKIENSNYEIEEFDLKRLISDNLKQTSVDFPPNAIDLFYNRLDDQLKNRLNPDNLIDIDFNDRTYYAFYDLEDGNYLTVDKKQNVYSLVHDALPMSKKMKYSLSEILDYIESGDFDKEKHLNERYKKSMKE